MKSVSTLLSLHENVKFRYFGDYQRDKQARGCNCKYQEPWPDIKILILTRLILPRTRNKAENAGLMSLIGTPQLWFRGQACPRSDASGMAD